MSVKSKILCLFSVLLLIFIVIFPSGLKAEKKFRFGTWTYGGTGNYDSAYALMKCLADTLNFTYLEDTSKDTVRFNAIQKCNLKIASQIYDATLTHNGPYYYSYTHHKVWEAEGNEGHPAYFNLVHPDSDIIFDGDTVAYMVLAGVDAAGLIQWGPAPAPNWYTQDTLFLGSPEKGYIDYTASYRVKAGLDPNMEFNDTVAVLYVTWGEDTLAIDTLWDSHFPADTMTYYLEDTLRWSSQACEGKSSRIAYNVYWFGRRNFYIDNVTLYDQNGLRLLNGELDEEIYAHMREFFKDSSSLDAWYMREELHGLGDDADAIEPWAYIEKLLADSSEKGVGSMHDAGDHDQYFLDEVEPQVLFIHKYNLHGGYWYGSEWRKPYAHNSDYQGEDSTSLQEYFDFLTGILGLYNDMCRAKNIDYIATLQGHSIQTRARGTIENPNDTLTWYWHLREPTGYELECYTNLAIAHGSKGVLYWKYWDGRYIETVLVRNGDHYDTVDNYCYQVVNGLIDTSANPTVRWYWVRDKVGPYMEKLGETYYDLTWLGAGSGDEVNSIENSFISNLTSQEYPDSSYIEVAFFIDSVGAAPDTDYFMLTNRRCLPDEDQNVTCHINKSGRYKIIDLCASVSDSCIPDSTITGYLETIDAIPFTTHLDPGEGKLFKMIPFSDSLNGSGVPMKWQGGLIVSGDITVNSGKTLNIYRPAEISFTKNFDCENSGVDTNRCEIIVNGSLRIDPGGGGLAKLIPTGTPALAPWYGIRVGNDTYPDARIFLDNIEIKTAYCGVDYQSSAPSDTIRNTFFNLCYLYGIRCKNDTLTIHDNIFKGVDYGIYCDSGSRAKIFGNEFTDTDYGIYVDNAYPNLNNEGLNHNQFSRLSYGIWVYNSGHRATPLLIKCQDMGDDITQSYISTEGDDDTCHIHIHSCNLVGDTTEWLPADTYIGVFGTSNFDSSIIFITSTCIHGYYYAGVLVVDSAWLDMGDNIPTGGYWPGTGYNCVFTCHTPCCVEDDTSDTCACDVREFYTNNRWHLAWDNWWGQNGRNPCIDGQILTYDALTIGPDSITNCPGDTGSGGGCPFIYVWDGEEYIEDNNILAESEYRTGCKKDVIDYYLLKKQPAYENGHYKIQISEFEREISYLDRIGLLIVDHPKETNIAVSPTGEVFTYEEIIKPETCFDEQGNDQLDKISSEDKNYFENDGPGYLILKLPSIKYEGISALFSGGPPPIKKVGHPSITYNHLKVEVWRDGEFWEQIATIPPRVNVDLSMTNLIPYIISEKNVKIKLSWNDSYKADLIGFYLLKDRIEDVKKLSLFEAGHSESGSIISQLSKEDDNYTVLNPGQKINLTFTSEPELENMERDFILVAKGHYVTDKNFASQHPSDIPDELKVSQNYPNPFNPTTEIRYDLHQNAWVKLTIYNVLGQKVKVLVNQHQEAGYKIIHWDGTNEKGEYVSTGIYYYTLQVGTQTETKKMLLLR